MQYGGKACPLLGSVGIGYLKPVKCHDCPLPIFMMYLKIPWLCRDLFDLIVSIALLQFDTCRNYIQYFFLPKFQWAWGYAALLLHSPTSSNRGVGIA